MEIAASKALTVLIDDLAIMMIFLLIGLVLRQLIKPLQKLFLPAGLIGGTIALILGPQVLGLIDIPSTWSGMATPMINIVLTCTIFGTVFSKDKMKSYSGAIIILVLTYFSQMFVGTLSGIFLEKVWNDMPSGWGLMAVFTYWGGHGAATTAGTLFESLGQDGMLSIGIIMATLGLIVAMVAGMVVVNIGVRKGWASHLKGESGKVELQELFVPAEKQKAIGKGTISSDAVNPLAFQFALILLSIWLGSVIFKFLAKLPVEPIANVMSKVPSLLYGIVGALIIWAIMKKTKLDRFADKNSIDNISGVALEICITTATATLNLKLFAAYIVPLMIHMVLIVAVMTLICVFLVRRYVKKDWFELCLLNYGQGHGSTPSGLALARCVDPDHEANSWEAFGIAVGIVSPFTSILAAVLPVLAVQSAWIPVGIGAAVSAVCIIIGELVLRKA